MPSSSKKQAHLMAAVAHNPAFAKKVGIPQSVGKDFNQADKGKTFKKGGEMKMKETMGPKGMGKDVEKGSNKLGKFGESKVQKKGHTKGKNLGDAQMATVGPKEFGATKMAKGGMCGGGKAAKKMAKGGSASSRADGIASKGKTKGTWC